MKKALLIGLKDLQIIFRDRAALILMLAAPYVLTLGMGFITGSFSSDGDSGLRDIPVSIVNQDEGELGEFLLDAFESPELAELFQVTVSDSSATARQQVDADETAAAIIIPTGFSSSIIPNSQTGSTTEPVVIELYSNPARPLSAGVVKAVVDEFINRVEAGRVSGQVVIGQLAMNGLITFDEVETKSQEIGANLATADFSSLITVEKENTAVQGSTFNPLAILAPSMAILFLMYTVSLGGRSILAEQQEGTLSRLLTTPTAASQILGGKILGIFFTGLAQLSILILSTSLMFNLQWGDWLAVMVLVPAIVAGASGWGLLLAAFARTPAQASSAGMTMMLTFGILGGTFIPTEAFPTWLKIVGRLTPNSWGVQGFNQLAQGATLTDILPSIAGLLGMTAVLFVVAVIVFRRNGFTK